MSKRHKCFLAGFVGVTLVLTLAWRWTCVPYADDFMYSHEYLIDGYGPEDENYLGEPIETFAQWRESVWRHYLTKNGRVANVLAFAVDSGPESLNRLLCALAIVLMPLLTLTAGGGRRLLASPFWLSIALAVCWLEFPWSDHMQSTDFLLNYQWSGVATLAVLTAMRRLSRLGRGEMALLAVLTAFAASMHEVYGIPLAVYMGVSALWCRGSKGNSRRWWLLAAAMVGVAVSISPGTIMLIGYEKEEASLNLSKYLGYRLILLFPVLVAVAFGIRRWRRVLPQWLLVPIMCAWVTGVAMNLVLNPDARALWSPLTYSAVGAVMVLRSEPWSQLRVWPTVRRVITVAVMGVYVVFMCELVKWQLRVADDFHRGFAALIEARDNMAYCDLATPFEPLPWWTLGIPINYRYSDPNNLYFENMAAGHTGHPAVLPERYRGVMPEQWDKVPGDNPFYYSAAGYVSTRPLGKFRIQVTLGEPTVATNPLNRLLTRLLWRNHRTEIVEGHTLAGAVTPDSTAVYVHPLKPLRRAGMGRVIERVDLIE